MGPLKMRDVAKPRLQSIEHLKLMILIHLFAENRKGAPFPFVEYRAAILTGDSELVKSKVSG